MPISFNHDTSIVNVAEELFTQVGAIFSSARVIAPTGFLLCNGDAINRTAFSRLFNVIVPNMGVATITIGSPGVVTKTAHGFQTGESIFLTTTGLLPTGLSANTLYFVINVTTDTFRLASNYANAIAETAINTSGTQNGIHSVFACPYGIGDGTSTFNLPDLRSSTLRGRGLSTKFSTNTTTRMGFSENDAFGSHNHGGGSHSHTYNDNEMTSYATPLATGGSWGPTNTTYSTSNSGTIISTQGENETRMKNLGVNFFIKY